MNIVKAPTFFRGNKAKELNDTIFRNTGCFVFLKTGEFPFTTCCQNYRQAMYSLILDSYVLFHDYGRFFLNSFAKEFKVEIPTILSDLLKFRGIFAHSQFEPDIGIMNSFARLITTSSIASKEEFYEKILNAKEDDYEKAYKALSDDLDAFYNALLGTKGKSGKRCFSKGIPPKNRLNAFQLSLNEALIKSILQVDSGKEKPSYSIGGVNYCANGNVKIECFKTVQQYIISKFLKNEYTTPDEIYLDFRKEIINTVNPPVIPLTRLICTR